MSKTAAALFYDMIFKPIEDFYILLSSEEAMAIRQWEYLYRIYISPNQSMPKTIYNWISTVQYIYTILLIITGVWKRD